MPGYPNERHGLSALFVTRHSVLIVPAAPSRDATVTAALWSAQRAIVGVDAFVEVLGVGSVEAGGLEVGAVGTGPASRAPPLLQPATMEARARAKMIALVMRWILPGARNSAGPHR
jgi:hypothetical protein